MFFRCWPIVTDVNILLIHASVELNLIQRWFNLLKHPFDGCCDPYECVTSHWNNLWYLFPTHFFESDLCVRVFPIQPMPIPYQSRQFLLLITVSSINDERKKTSTKWPLNVGNTHLWARHQTQNLSYRFTFQWNVLYVPAILFEISTF